MRVLSRLERSCRRLDRLEGWLAGRQSWPLSRRLRQALERPSAAGLDQGLIVYGLATVLLVPLLAVLSLLLASYRTSLGAARVVLGGWRQLELLRLLSLARPAALAEGQLLEAVYRRPWRAPREPEAPFAGHPPGELVQLAEERLWPLIRAGMTIGRGRSRPPIGR